MGEEGSERLRDRKKMGRVRYESSQDQRFTPREPNGAAPPPISDEVRDLLHSRGIPWEPLGLQGVSLPASAAVVRERLDFLQALGLDPALGGPPLAAPPGLQRLQGLPLVLAYLEGVPDHQGGPPGLVRAYPGVLRLQRRA